MSAIAAWSVIIVFALFMGLFPHFYSLALVRKWARSHGFTVVKIRRTLGTPSKPFRLHPLIWYAEMRDNAEKEYTAYFDCGSDLTGLANDAVKVEWVRRHSG